MRFLPYLTLFLALPAFAGTECSPCRGYGSPFGPGYNYYCYFVKSGTKLVAAYRFGEEGEECRAARQENRACATSGEEEITPPMGGDPCPRL